MARGFSYAPGASAELEEAQQPGLHKTHIMALGASKNHLVRATVAGRDDCPLGLMVTLAHDYHLEVRCAVARNPIAQRTVMAYLAADRHVEVLKALIENPSLPEEILEELAFHKRKEVRAAAAARLDSEVPGVVHEEEEDEHTPELAEHVTPVLEQIQQGQMTADGTVVPQLEPTANVVDIATRSPITNPVADPTHAPTAQESWSHSTPAVPQIFAPHSTPDAPVPTRTAPVRGFKPKE